MLTVLVTGGAGFLGSHLVNLLLEQDRNVISMDSLQTGSVEHVEKLKNHERFTFIQHDVTKAFPETIKKVDQIYHLACPASPTRFPEYPISILDTCYLGTKNVLELAMECNARVLLASTSEVYGDARICPQPETYWGNVNSFGPRSCYDEGKRVAEALAYSYRLQHNVEVRICRIFNTYGPGMRLDDGRVLPEFVSAALAGKDMTITGDGKASRCFQYASDCIAGMNKLMESDCTVPVNIGIEQETSIAEFARVVSEIIAKKTGQPPTGAKCTPARKDDPIRRQPDISLAKEKLQWAPKVGLMEGLEKTIDWFIETQTAARSQATCEGGC